MIRIVVGGQLAKNEIASKIDKIAGDKVSVKVTGDLDGAMSVKKGFADYYFGSCATGAGGSLALAIALLGMNKCLTVATPSKMASDAEMINAVKNGVVAFGFVPDCLDHVLDVIIPQIING